MEAVEKSLLDGSLYDVYGLVEEWNATMCLFDRWIPLANDKPWTDASAKSHASHGSEKYQGEEASLLAEAKKNVKIRQALAGDIHIYEQIILPKFLMIGGR